MSTDKCQTSAELAGAEDGNPRGDAQVCTLENSFLLRTRDDIGRLKALVDRAVAGDWTVLKECERISHSIHGAGAMFGYRQLSKDAGAMERLVREILRSPVATCSADSAVLLPLIESTEELAKALLATDWASVPANGMFQAPVMAR